MSKKLIISLVAVGIVVAVVLILFWTLFALSSVTVDFQSTLVNLKGFSAEEIVEAGDFHFGACVLFEGKKRSVQKIYDKALENPKFAYIRVVNIETVFPNKFVIHVAEREELFAIENNGQTFVCDRDFRVLNILNDEELALNFDAVSKTKSCLQKTDASAAKYVSTQNNPIFLTGLEIENETIVIGDFLEIGQASMKNLYSAFVRNNRSYLEVVGKFKEAELSSYVEDVTNEKFDALTLSTFDDQEFVIKNPDFALANKIALMYAVESALFSQNVDESGDILSLDGQKIYLFKNEKGQYLFELEEAQEPESEHLEKVALNFELLKNCRIVVDNLTLSEFVEVSESDIYFYLQEKTATLEND